MPKTIRHKYLDVEGICQLTWVGRLVSVPGPKENISIRAYFSKISPPAFADGQLKRTGRAFWKDIPIGTIINIPIGTVFYDGIPVDRNYDNVFATYESILILDLEDENLMIANRWHTHPGTSNSQEKPPPILPRSVGSLPEDPEYDGELLFVGSNGDPYAFAIPCYEVFRFFYAVSSPMAEVFLDSRFLEWGVHVWNPERSIFDLENREVLLWLRQWMHDRDAWFIAAIAFDPISIQRGMDIYRSIAVDRRRILRAVPPMHEWISIRAKWISVRNSLGTTTKIITQIINTDWQPPFDKLRFDRDNDGRKGPNSDGEQKQQISRPRIKLPNNPVIEPAVISLTDQPSNPEYPLETISVEEITNRFNWLIHAEIEKLPQLDTQYQGEKHHAMVFERWSNLLSTVQGTSSSEAVQSVVLTAIDQTILSSKEFEKDELHSPDEPLILSNGDILKIAHGLVNIHKKTTATVEFLALWGKPIYQDGYSLYRLPKTISGDSYSWLFKMKSRVPRIGLAAKITRQNEKSGLSETRFLLDFEPNPENSNIVIVWTNATIELQSHDLCRLIRGFAQSKSVMKDLSRINDLQMGHRKHSIRPDDLNNGSIFLERIFTTPPSNK